MSARYCAPRPNPIGAIAVLRARTISSPDFSETSTAALAGSAFPPINDNPTGGGMQRQSPERTAPGAYRLPRGRGKGMGKLARQASTPAATFDSNLRLT